MNSGNTNSLRNTLINQVQGAGVITLQQKKNWLIDWYFSNDPMGSIYLATLRNPALVSNYQTNPGMLYGTPFATGMENYFGKIKNYFGQSMFDQLVTEFAQQSNLYVDELRIDDFHIYGSSRLGVYEANKTISRRVARDLNNDKQISNNEYEVETPEEVLYLFSSYQLERGAKRYELANHLGNVLTVISDKKTANFTGSTFTHFTAERISATDYSPFGAPLAGRTWNGGEYRFGMNGMEKDDEVVGAGNSYTTDYRQYDPRLGRWMSIDPMFRNFPWQSPYAAFDNKPLLIKDPRGLAGESANDGPSEKVRQRSQKKFDKKISEPLRAFEANLLAQGVTGTQLQTQVQNEANRLASKYQNKKWLQVVGGLRSARKEQSSATGVENNKTVGIVAYAQQAPQNVQVNNQRPANANMTNTSNTGVTALPGATVNVQFNPLAAPNSLVVNGVDAQGRTALITSTNGLISDPNNTTGVYMFSTTTVITPANAGQIQYTVQNTNINSTMDRWQLQIQVINPPVLNPYPIITYVTPY